MANQCALAADGTLLDAAQIQWYNDPDDDNPLQVPTQPEPARRSARIPRPAPKLVDPNNALLCKRKAVSVVMSSEEDEGGDAADDSGVITDSAAPADEMDVDNDTPSAYQQTKGMSDADRKVS